MEFGKDVVQLMRGMLTEFHTRIKYEQPINIIEKLLQI